jgi:5-(carboxyamino)imidazole ribonucleotide synthase
MAADRPIMPGATLGMLGGGQLGRMFTIAARTMGYRVLVLDPDPHSPAGALADEHVHAGYLDTAALDRLAAECAAVSTEFENVPAEALARLAEHCVVRPAGEAVGPTQNRLCEKAFFDAHGLPTVPWAAVSSQADLKSALAAVGTPSLLKHAAGGYDGKGQAPVETPDAAADAYTGLGEAECILERRVSLARELSVIVCRAVDGTVACYPPGENVHVDGILSTTTLPAAVDPAMAERARAIAAATAEALGYVGVLGVELFVTADDEILVNELAPRPHNSGHYTLDASATTQFEQQVRLLCGFGPGSTELLSPVAMVNLLGDLWADGDPDWSPVFAMPGAYLHLYGKREPRPGRKMGHLNVLATDAATALERARSLHGQLAAS